jgi:hypothetical protein
MLPPMMPKTNQQSPMEYSMLNSRTRIFLPKVLGRTNGPLILASLLLMATLAAPAWAVTCTTQGSMSAADRDALVAAASPLASALTAQKLDVLQASLLPSVQGDWDGIKGVAQSAAPLLKGGDLHWRNVYLLDATDLKAPADTLFYCTNSDNSVTVTISLRSLPVGKYGLLIGDSTSTPFAGQVGMILGADSSAAWKLGGLFAREGALEGHDSIWYWTHARELATKKSPWSAWYTYDAARWLELPLDNLGSPNLEKLNKEQSLIGSDPASILPLVITSGAAADSASGNAKSWKVTGLRFDAALHSADLALTYEGSGITEPIAARAEAVAVMSGLLKAHPDLRDNFHGLWAYAEKDGRQSFAIELAMHDIP